MLALAAGMSHALFAVSAAAGIVFAVATVTRRNPIYSALYLIFFFLTVAADFLLLDASFLAFMQLLVYSGAIMVLYLFVIMLINPREEDLPEEGGVLDRGIALTISLVLFVFLYIAIERSPTIQGLQPFPELAPAPATVVARVADGVARVDEYAHGGIFAFGRELFARHLLVFELTSILILAAIVGAVHLSIRRRVAPKPKGPRKVNVIPEHARRKREAAAHV